MLPFVLTGHASSSPSVQICTVAFNVTDTKISFVYITWRNVLFVSYSNASNVSDWHDSGAVNAKIEM